MSESILKDKSFLFAVRIVKLYQNLIDNKREYHLGKQLIRSATSVGALIREAQNAETPKDFIHKLGIAQKECDETIYWLEILSESGYLSATEFKGLHADANELLKMLRSAIITSKKKLLDH